MPTLEIEFDQHDSLFFEELNKRLMSSGCETFKDFNIKIDSLTIAARVAQPCGMPIICGIKIITQVLINRDNQILLEEEFIKNTSDLNLKIDEIIKDPDEIYSYKNEVTLSFVRDKKANVKQSKIVFHAFVASYNKYMDSISVNLFKKPLQQLSLKQTRQA